jgi:hypothetical protein
MPHSFFLERLMAQKKEINENSYMFSFVGPRPLKVRASFKHLDSHRSATTKGRFAVKNISQKLVI